MSGFFEKKKQRATRGKVMIIAIALFVAASTLLNISVDLTLVLSVLNIVCAVALIKGVEWARYYLAAVGAFTTALSIVGLFSSRPTGGALVFVLVLLAGHIACIVLLLFSRSVKEYMYDVKN